MNNPAQPSYFTAEEWGITYQDPTSSVPWTDRTPARRECFMSPGGGVSYNYGSGPGRREYRSVEMTPAVARIMEDVNERLWSNVPRDYSRTCNTVDAYRTAFELHPSRLLLNGCFLNHYRDQTHALGWHADDFPGMDHRHPLVVVSFGEEREIWVRPKGFKGRVPEGSRWKLASASVFVMPPRYQHDYEHRIPKGGRRMGPRTSLTFRRFLPPGSGAV